MAELAERAQALKEAVEADETFKDAFAEALKAGDIEAAVKLAADKGIDFAIEELTPDTEGRELDDAELDAVAGGYSWGDFGFDAACVAMCLTFIVAQ